jgi:hypothetical protein
MTETRTDKRRAPTPRGFAGRSERLNRTFQERLVNDLRVAGITTVPAANRYRHERVLSTYDARFTHAPTDPASTFVPLGQMDLTHISVTKERAPSPWTIRSPSRACACRSTRSRAAAPAESLVL